MGRMLHLLRKVRFEYHAIVARSPRLSWLHRPNIWWQQYKIARYYADQGGSPDECVVGPHSELVIDGFQGSANSFASAALKYAQRQTVQITHHLHSPAQIIQAVELNIPTLVTLREPEGATVSLTSRWPHISVKQALRAYAHFYEAVEPYTHGVVISPFSCTTRHLDLVVRTLNDRYGTSFDPFVHTEENMRRLRNPDDQPSHEEDRDAIKRQKRAEYHSPNLERYRRRAEDVYARMLSASPLPE